MRNIFFPVFDELELPLSVVAVGEREKEEYVFREGEYLGAHLMLSKKGCGVLEIDGQSYSLEENTLFFIDKGAKHLYYPRCEDWHTAWIIFNDNHYLAQSVYSTFKRPGVINRSTYYKYFNAIFEAAKPGDVPSVFKASALLYTLMAELACERLCKNEENCVQQVNAALTFIKEHSGENIGLAEISRAANLSPQYLCNLFKKHMNITPYEYLIQHRIERSKSLMSDPSHTLRDICAESGFSNLSYFCYVFKKHEGMPPGEFRKMIRG